jgi:hypothetical protein
MRIWAALKAPFVWLWRWWSGGLLSVKLQDKNTDVRNEAEEAVARIVYETNLPHDCVVATTLQGGPGIIIKHNNGQEGFVHHTYTLAADKAIEWLTRREGRFIQTGAATQLSRKNQKVFDARRREVRRSENDKDRKRKAH